MEGILGEIRLFGGNYAWQGWAECDGQVLPIMQHQALYSLLGPTYGGDGRSTFALPDLRGRTPVGTGEGPGLPDVDLGETGDIDTSTGKPRAGTLGLTYLICMNGTYPPRN